MILQRTEEVIEPEAFTRNSEAQCFTPKPSTKKSVFRALRHIFDDGRTLLVRLEFLRTSGPSACAGRPRVGVGHEGVPTFHLIAALAASSEYCQGQEADRRRCVVTRQRPARLFYLFVMLRSLSLHPSQQPSSKQPHEDSAAVGK